MGLEGLLLGHVASLLLTAWLSWKLLARYYDPGLLLRAPLPVALRRETLKTGLAMLPPNVARRAYSDLPPVLLNAMLPGAAGATAAGLFGIARKIASIPLIVRQSFLYVLAPLSSAQAALDRREIAPLYSFSTHVSVLLALPIAGLMILLAADMLTGFATGAEAAISVVIILLAARGIEAALGPATPIVEMVGHRGLPLFNSLIGMAIWLIVGAWLVPDTWRVGHGNCGFGGGYTNGIVGGCRALRIGSDQSFRPWLLAGAAGGTRGHCDPVGAGRGDAAYGPALPGDRLARLVLADIMAGA